MRPEIFLLRTGSRHGRGLDGVCRRLKRVAPLLAAPLAVLLTPGRADAVLNYNIFESGGNVIVRTSGSLTLPNPFRSSSITVSGSWAPSGGAVASGPVENTASAFKIL